MGVIMDLRFPSSNKVTTANAGGRWQFRFRGSRRRPGVAEFYRSPQKSTAPQMETPIAGQPRGESVRRGYRFVRIMIKKLATQPEPMAPRRNRPTNAGRRPRVLALAASPQGRRTAPRPAAAIARV